MSRLRLVFVGALVALVLPLTAGTASAQSGEITITGAEVVTDFGKPSGSDVNVIGTGTCTAPGVVIIKVRIKDQVTGGVAAGTGFTQCVSAGEHIQWLVTAANPPVPTVRPGDKADVQASATGGINAADEKVVIVQQFH